MPKKRKTKYEVIDISKIRKSSVHWTREFSPEKLNELCENISTVGEVLTPISVRPKKDGKGYEYFTGDRRFQAVKKLKMKAIPCIVKDKDDLDARQESISENLGREDFAPAVEDEAIRELVDIKKKQLLRDKLDLPDPDRSKGAKTGRPEELDNAAIKAVAAQQGISTRTVMRAVAIDNLIKAAAKAYKEEKISKRQADLLSRMDEDEQDEELQLMLNETQDETEERLKEAKARKPAPPLPAGNKGTHNVNPALRMFDRIVVMTRELETYARKLREDITEETVAALRDLDKSDLVACNQALTRLLADLEVASAWRPHSRR